MARSFKYHRPRSVVAAGAEEPNALVNLGKGAAFEPNQRATTQELFDGLFELADNWTPNISAIEIRDFFKFMELQIKYPKYDSYMNV